MKKTIAILSLISFSIYCNAQTLDEDFGVKGVLTTHLDKSATISSIASQTNGRILVVGNYIDGGHNGLTDFVVIRYKDDELDKSFDLDGIAIGNLPGKAIVHSLIVQPTGKILIAGYTSINNNTDFGLVRFNNDGSPDLLFGTNGKVITDFNGGTDESTGMILQKDGKIILCGYSISSIGYNMALVRYEVNGKLDTSFANGGKLVYSFGPSSDFANAIALQQDGKIIVGGRTHVSSYDFALIRINTDGSIDKSFGIDGKVNFKTGIDDEVSSLLIQNDGKILIGGRSSHAHDNPTSGEPSTDYDLVIARLNKDGSLDPSFGKNGINLMYIMNSPTGICLDIMLLPNEKILVTRESSYVYDKLPFKLMLFTANGNLENTFNNDGNFTLPGFAFNKMLNLNNGKIIISNLFSFKLVRLNIDGSSNGNVSDVFETDLSIYPNPSTGNFTIEIKDPGTNSSIDIIDVTGKTVQSEQTIPYKEYYTINFKGASGIYYLKVKTTNQISYKKIIIH